MLSFLLLLMSFSGPSSASYNSIGRGQYCQSSRKDFFHLFKGSGAGDLSLESLAKMKSSVKTNKEKFKSSSINFVKPIIPFPSIVDMMSKSQEFIPSPIDPNIVVEDVKVSVNIESI